tara:strand:- start:2399 stop:2602 length:204 start_codon:yes stop_codon:yes gene_type:complete
MKAGDLVRRKKPAHSDSHPFYCGDFGIIIEKVRGANPYIYYMVKWLGKYNCATPLTENQLEVVNAGR